MNRPYIIAEIGVNYYDIADKYQVSVMDAAKLMVVQAKNSGADAVKFQSYKADKIVSKNSPSYWDTSFESTTSQYELFKKFDKFGETEYRYLADFCGSKEIDFMCTPFDLDSVGYLDDIVRYHKISSSDITNYPLLIRVGETGKKIILSTGASTMDEVAEAIEVIESTGNTDIVLLHCVLNYPTTNDNANLSMIHELKKFNKEVGYSDHTLPDDNMLILTTSVIMGASWVEKHFTLDKGIPGNDHYHSMSPQDLRRFVTNVDLIQEITKVGNLENQELSRINARRSVYVSGDLKKGSVLTLDNMVCKRPAVGIPASEFHELIGKHINRDVSDDEVLTSDIFI